MAKMAITELRRTGAGVVPDLARFEWDSATHTSMQGPLEHTLTVRTVRTDLPGSEEPVEQVLGSSWDNFDFYGEWSNRWAGIGFAMKMYREFAAFVARGPLVHLQIDQLSFIGILVQLTLTYQTRDRIGWRCQISPHRNVAVGSTRREDQVAVSQPLGRRVAEAKAQVAKLAASAATMTALPLATDTAATSAASVATATDAVAKAEAAAESGLSTDAERTLLNMAANFRRVRAATLETTFALSERRADMESAYDDAINTLKVEEWLRTTRTEALRAAGMSRLAERDMLARAERRPQAIHRVTAGESLERISLRYYGTAANWRAIYDANNLSSLRLTGNEELVIPAQAA